MSSTEYSYDMEVVTASTKQKVKSAVEILLVMLILPILILIARSTWAYQQNHFFDLSFALFILIGLQACSRRFSHVMAVKRVMNALSVYAICLIAFPGSQLINGIFQSNIDIFLFGIIFAAFNLIVARGSGLSNKIFVTLSGYVLSLFSMLQLIIVGGSLSAAMCIFSGVVVYLLGIVVIQNYLRLLGLLLFLVPLGYEVYHVIHLMNFSSWMVLAMVAVFVIIVTFLPEQFGAKLKYKWSQWIFPREAKNSVK